MATKGQKFKKYTEEIKIEIIKEYLEGENGGTISIGKKYGISSHTIDTWISKFKKQGDVKPLPRGRQKSTEEINYKERYEILKKYQTFLKAQREKK